MARNLDSERRLAPCPCLNLLYQGRAGQGTNLVFRQNKRTKAKGILKGTTSYLTIYSSIGISSTIAAVHVSFYLVFTRDRGYCWWVDREVVVFRFLADKLTWFQ